MKKTLREPTLHCLESEHTYRGLSRYNLLYLLSHIMTENSDRISEIDPALHQHMKSYPAEGCPVEVLRPTSELLHAVTRLLHGLDRWRVAATIPRRYEFVLAQALNESAKAGDVIQRLSDWKSGIHRLKDCDCEWLGFDIVEWPSDWSVISHAYEWSRFPLSLNNYGILESWRSAQEVWMRYKVGGDPDMGPAEGYVIVGLVSLGDAAQGSG